MILNRYEKLQSSHKFSKIFQGRESISNMRHPVPTTYHHLQHVSIHTSHWGQYIISISACAINKNELACKVHACQRERRPPSPPHKGLNSPKRFTNLLSGPMSIMGLMHQTPKSCDALIEVFKFIRYV
jgi:hypothetical protein